ncbi:MAG TPA: ABC transporter permease [Planctomycetaceae bacterium]|nr:ABC transporter permease [Planctomycetaceae bacterium]
MNGQRWIRRAAILLPWALLALGVWLVWSQVSRPAFLIQAGDVKARVGCLALVMTMIVITGGIDLSVGSVLALASVVMALVWESGYSVGLAAGAGILTGVVAGIGNGTLVTVGMSPLVATLATMAFFRGLAVTFAGGDKITDFDDPGWNLQRLAGWPTEYWLLLVLFLTTTLLLHGTRFGRRCFAIGDNPQAARYAAIPVKGTQFWLYVASGLVAGLLAVIYTMRKGANPEAHAGLELEAIACVVVGGTLITGGRGATWLTLLGLAVIASLDLGLELLDSSVGIFKADARLMLIGGLLILVAIFNQWVFRHQERQ